MMNKIKNIITPLFLLFLWTIITGIIAFLRDSGVEGWGYVAAFMVCLFSLGPLVIDFIMKMLIKDKRKNFIAQIPIAIIITLLYLIWGLIGKL